MAGRKTEYYEARVMGHLFGNRWDPFVPTFWLALCSTPPTDASPGTEIAASGYQRTRLMNRASQWTEPGAHGEVSNRYKLSTPVLKQPASVGHIELWDAKTGGNRLYWGVLVDAGGEPTVVSVPVGHRLRFLPNKLRIRED